MFRNLLRFLLVMVTALAPAAAMAEEPYYFHKAGVSRETYMDDVNDCAELAGGIRVAHYEVRALNPRARYSAISVGIASFFATLTERKLQRRLVSRVERTCMADKGYLRRSIDKENWRQVRDLEGEAQIDRMFALVSAQEPIGKVLVE